MTTSDMIPSQLRLLPLMSRMPAEYVATTAHGDPVVACDFYVVGAEGGDSVPGGYQLGQILNIDHHAPTQRMRRRISSATLALERAKADLIVHDRAAKVVVNHVDCDSILTAGIVTGRLLPERRFSDAAIAADHTGEENRIADLLQGLDAHQSRSSRSPDLGLSFRNLMRLLEGADLEPFAQEALELRLRARASAEALVVSGAFSFIGPVAVAVLDKPIDGEFFPALLADATVILLMNPLTQNTSRWQVKVRLGLQAPSGFALSDVGIETIDPAYGGRWNAGSNRRGGGTALTPERYVTALSHRVKASLSAMSPAASIHHGGRQ